MKRWFLTLVAVLALGDVAWPQRVVPPAIDRASVLERSVAGLPRAEPGAWGNWDPAVMPTETLQGPYLAALDTYQRDDLLAAAALCMDQLEVHADYPATLLLLGVTLYRLQRYGEAIRCYERLLAQRPETVVRTRQLGHCYYSVGRPQDALAHYDRILAKQPNDFAARRARGLVRMKNGDEEGALVDLQAVLSARPKDAEALYFLALLYYDLDESQPEGNDPGENRLGESDQVLEATVRARDARPFDPRVWYLLAQVHLDAGESEKANAAKERYDLLLATETAIRQWNQRIYLEPDNVEWLEKVARLRLAAGDLDRAEIAYARLARAASRTGNVEVVGRAKRSLRAIKSRK